MGLLADKLTNTILSSTKQKTIFYLFAFACVPAYFLSALWLPIPAWLYIIIVIAAFAQIIGWILFFRPIVANHPTLFSQTDKAVKYLFYLSAIALSIKLLLQLGSTIPALSTWAFGFRPIVIGYLHLVFLGIFSIFILAYALYHQYFVLSKKTMMGIWIFIAGIILNEMFLMAEGLGAVTYQAVPFVNELLLAAACVMLIGLLVLNIVITRKLR
jgi:hypothetical protein